MKSITYVAGVVYRHIDRPSPDGDIVCPDCHCTDVELHTYRYRKPKHIHAERPCRLIIKVGKYRCLNPNCRRKYFTARVREAGPHARHSQAAKAKAKKLYRKGNASLREVQNQMREDFHNSAGPDTSHRQQCIGAGKSSVLRWHQDELAQDYPQIDRLTFSHVLVIDEVYSRTAGERDYVLSAVDPINHISIHVIIEKLDADSVGEALQVIKDLGANPQVIVSDLAKYYPEAFAQVWPKANPSSAVSTSYEFSTSF